MVLLPLCNITNEDTTQVSPRKRFRKTICHVPSHASNEEEEEPPATESSNETMESEGKELPTSSVGGVIYFDDDDDVDVAAVSASKRQKRRESIIFPNTIAPLHQEEDSAQDGGGMQEETQSGPTNDFELELDQGDHDDDPVISTRKRLSKRQSMLLPSDVALFQKEVATQVFGHQETDLPLDPQEMDLSEEETTTPRLAKRQSMVLPSILLQDDETREYFQELTSHPQEANVAEENVVTEQNNNDESKPPRGKMPAIQSLEQQQGRLHNNVGIEAAAVATHASFADECTTNPTEGNETEYIRSLVREYCALSPSERVLSKQAEEIERLTSYSLVPPAAKQHRARSVDLNWSGSPTEAPKAHVAQMPKRELLLKLGALVELIDERKVQDQQHMEAHTECRFQRSRSGKYRYFHTLTNDKVSPAMYEERYLAVLRQTKSKSQEHIQDWIQSLEDSSRSVGEHVMKTGTVVDCELPCGVEEKDEQSLKASPPAKSQVEQSVLSFGSVDRTTDCSSEPLDTSDSSNVVLEQFFANDMELVDVSSSSLTDSLLETETRAPENDNQQGLPLASHHQDSEPTSSLETGDSSNLPMEQGSTQANDMELVDASSSSPTDSLLGMHASERDNQKELLPLPDRDEASGDPAIAAAEATLWAAIDAALETYSRQMIRIREARRLV
jgi:hypothetical protein